MVLQWFTYTNPLRYYLVIIRGTFLKGIGIERLVAGFSGDGGARCGSADAEHSAVPQDPRITVGQMSGRSVERLSGGFIPAQDAVPGLLRGFGEPKELAILEIDDAFLDQIVEIDGATPEMFADQHDGYRLDFPGLNESENLEQFVERAVAVGKGDQGFGPQQEMQLARGKIVKAKTEIGRDVGIRILLVRQFDLQADGFRADVECAAVGGLHEAGPAAVGVLADFRQL